MTEKWTRQCDTVHAKMANAARAYVDAAAKHKSKEMYILGVKLRLVMQELISLQAHEGTYELTSQFKASFFDVGNVLEEMEEGHD